MSEDIASLVLKVDSTQPKQASQEVENLTKKGKELEAQMVRELALYGKVGRAAQVRYDVEKGALRGLDAAQKARLIGLAEEYDRTERLTKAAKRYGIAIGAAVTIAGGIAVHAIFEATTESEDALAQLEARLKSTQHVAGMYRSELTALASQMQLTTRYSDETVMSAESMLLTFTKISRQTFPDALRVTLDLATAMKMDLDSAAKLVGKALNDPEKGLTALTRAGVQFSEQQQKVIKNLLETGRQAEAQKMILGELETQMGGAADAAGGTLSGSLTRLKNVFDDLLEGDSGGEGVRGTVDALNELIDTLNDPNVRKGAGEVVEGLIDITGWLVKVIAKAGEAGAAIKDVFLTSTEKQSTAVLTNRKNDLEGQMYGLQRQNRATSSFANNPFFKYNPATAGVAALVGLGNRIDTSALERVKKELGEVEAELDRRSKAAGQDYQQHRGLPADFGLYVNPHPTASGGAGEDDDGASSKAAKAAERAQKQRERDFENLKDQLATEEEAIRKSYDERQRIIDQSTKAGSAEREELSSRNKAMMDKELSDLSEQRGRELEDLRKSLRSEEEEIKESYEARMKIVMDNTQEGSALREEMSAKVKAEYEQDLAEYQANQEQKKNALMQEYMTDLELLRAHHEERRKEILTSTALTEEERQNLLRQEEEKFMRESAAREQQRLSMITSSAGGMFDALGQLIATYAQNSGKEQKRLFKLAQAFSIASAVISIATGIAKAQELGYPMNIFESIRVAAVGAVQIATIKSQQYAGAYDQGGHIPAGRWGVVGELGPEIVRGPATVTGRELTARNAGSGGGMGNVYVTVQVSSDGSSKTSTDSDTQQGRQLGQLVGAKCREVIQQEMRPGGSLWRGGVRT